MKKYFRYLLIFSFFSYYIIMILSSAGWIDKTIRPLEILSIEKLVKIDDTTYLGTYPSKQRLEEYKKSIGLERVIVLLYSNVPVSRELIQMEKPRLKELDIEFVSVPISYFSDNLRDYELINMMLRSDSKVTLIHTYLYDERLKILENLLKLSRR